MRQIGTLSSELQARRLGDYLLTQGIKSQADPADGQWAVWVHDEDRVAAAREIFQKFQADPDADDYRAAETLADGLRSASIAREARIRRNIVDVRSQWTNPRTAQRPLTIFLILFSVAVGLLTNLGGDSAIVPAIGGGERDSRAEALLRDLQFASRSRPEWRPSGWRWVGGLDRDSEIRRGEVWRLVTPIFIHYGVLHLVFNMLWLHGLGSAVEIRIGTARYLLLVLFVAISSNVAQCLWSGPAFGGMSGVVSGLFGYVWMKSRFDPTAGLAIDPGTVTMMLFWMGLCLTGAVGPIANAAHVVGLLAGVTAGLAPVIWRRAAG